VEEGDIWSDGEFLKDLQEGDDLGDKMYNAITKAAGVGYEEICLIGSDNMEISPSVILEGFESLGNSDIVIGPSRDGGYYLIGMKKPHANIFHISGWSTSTVLEETLSKAKMLNLTCHLLEELNDIDELEDIRDEDRDYLLN
jgi:rSAM/selenodomain-associated transferase 1